MDGLCTTFRSKLLKRKLKSLSSMQAKISLMAPEPNPQPQSKPTPPVATPSNFEKCTSILDNRITEEETKHMFSRRNIHLFLPISVVWVERRAWWVTGQSLPSAHSPPSLLPIHPPAVQLRRRWRRPTRLPALAMGKHQGLFFCAPVRHRQVKSLGLYTW